MRDGRCLVIMDIEYSNFGFPPRKPSARPVCPKAPSFLSLFNVLCQFKGLVLLNISTVMPYF